jgi:Ca2+-binding RTX toxin-like protein
MSNGLASATQRVERLEERTMLSSATRHGDRLVILGDSGASNVCVVALDSAKQFLFVNLNGTEFTFGRDKVHAIDYVGGDANDWFQVDQSRAKFDVFVRFRGNGGDDTFIGGNERDLVFGGAGSDTLSTGNGADTIVGGPGEDTITTGDGAKVIFGGAGNDTITTGRGRGYIFGGTAHNLIKTGGDRFEIFGGPGSNTLIGQGHDTLWGGGGKDVLIGGEEQHRGQFGRITQLKHVLLPEAPR